MTMILMIPRARLARLAVTMYLASSMTMIMMIPRARLARLAVTTALAHNNKPWS